MASITVSPSKHKGGSFLLETSTPEEMFSPEDFTEEHRAIARCSSVKSSGDKISSGVDVSSRNEPPLCLLGEAVVDAIWLFP